MRIAGHAERRRQVRDQQLRLARFRHGQQRLRLGRKHRVERAFAQAVALGLVGAAGLGLARALRSAQAGDGRADGKGDDAEIDAEREQRARVEQRARRVAAKRRPNGRKGRADEQDDDAEQHFWPP